MRVTSFVAVVIVLALGFAGFKAWSAIDEAREAQKKAELELGMVSGRVLSATFVAARKLLVGTVTGDIVVKSDDKGWWSNSQFTRAPATIDYFIDLAKVDKNSFRWNESENVMSVDIPEITIAAPNIDFEKAEIRQGGFWISRESGQRLQNQAVVRLNVQARLAGSRAENVEKARENARRVVEDFVRLPLNAAGFSSLRVVVRFPDEAKPRNLSQENWDQSKPVAEVLAESAGKRAVAR